MIGRADGHCIDMIRFAIEHLPEVFVASGLRVRLDRTSGTHVVDIAKRNKADAQRANCGNIGAPHASHSNRGNIHGFTGRNKSAPAEHPAGHYCET